MKKRPLGQNFLNDYNVAQEIIRLANIKDDTPVLEIGPGRGILTKYLLELGPLTAIEIDPALCDELDKKFGSHANFKLIQADAAKFDYGSIAPGFKVVSNLPYYAGTPIMKRLISYGNKIVDMTLMLQKEVVDRLSAMPGRKEYGSLTVFTQFHCKVERLLEVDKSCFSPPPKIDSSVVKLTPLSSPRVEVEDKKLFFKIVSAAFFHKRKMLRNNLKGLNISPDTIKMSGIDLTRRGETLSMEDFAALSNLVQSENG